MVKKKNNEFGYCCELMVKFADDPRIGINYNKKLREYTIDLFTGSLQGIYYCPFCEFKLPKDLRDEWFEVLEKEYDLDDPRSIEQSIFIPEEFKSDEWWKKRNL